MELTAELFTLIVISGGITSMLLTPLLLEQYFKRRVLKKFAGFERVTDFLSDAKNEEAVEGALGSITQLGTLASNANAILDDEEAFNAILSTIATRVMHSFKMSLMGTASGDVKKMARAERIVNEAMIRGVQEFSPALKILFKMTGLDEELNADPELLPLIMQVVSQNDGLMNMLTGLGGFSNVGTVQGTQAQEEMVRDKLGIDF